MKTPARKRHVYPSCTFLFLKRHLEQVEARAKSLAGQAASLAITDDLELGSSDRLDKFLAFVQVKKSVEALG